MRKFVLKSHLILACFFTPYIVLVAISGTAYLSGFKGTFNETELQKFEMDLPEDQKQQETLLSQKIREFGYKLSYEYVKFAGTKKIFRPSSKQHFMVKSEGSTQTLYRVQPNFLRSMMELHFGHGPKVFKQISIFFGVCLLLILISGILLGLWSRAFRKTSIIGVGIGVISIVLLSGLLF
ncbi:MAG: PepSY domain-containing protein [Bdellovibrionota bacterium]|nr:PepSY domain-containing protein [Bdellovibrionota bacterium]